jgi:hypothetical protein
MGEETDKAAKRGPVIGGAGRSGIALKKRGRIYGGRLRCGADTRERPEGFAYGRKVQSDAQYRWH